MRNNHQYSAFGLLCQDFFQEIFSRSFDLFSIPCHPALRSNFFIVPHSKRFVKNFFRKSSAPQRVKPPLPLSFFRFVLCSNFYKLPHLEPFVKNFFGKFSAPPGLSLSASLFQTPSAKQLAYSTTPPPLCQYPFFTFSLFFSCSVSLCSHSVIASAPPS